MAHFCYLLQCSDDSYYTGWTLDPKRREAQHNAGRGASYTRQHRPVRLVYVEEVPTLSAALKREQALKKYSHAQKAQLAQAYRQAGMAPIKKEITVISPGRVNLLGEHVDYNDGLVLPAAIDREVTLHAAWHDDQILNLTATDLNESVSLNLSELEMKVDLHGAPLPGWALYPAGMAWALQQHSLTTIGCDVSFSSNVPIGAGLSSSAAVEVGFGVLWQALGGWKLDRMTLARYAQQAEVSYVGVNCGLMDQFACANGVANAALLLDTRSYEWRPVKLPKGVRIVIADSGVRRKLVTSEYNTRHDECNQAVAILQRTHPEIRALRDVSIEMLKASQEEMPTNVYKRARHIVSEIARVNEAVKLLDEGDAVGFGHLMAQTHASLRDDYEVSCPELDVLVESALKLPGCLGARLTGAGFGGCTVNLVKVSAVKAFSELLQREYKEKTGREATVYPCRAADGAYVQD